MVGDPPTSDKTLIWSPSTKLKNQCYSFVEALPVLFTNWNPAKLETPKRDSGSWDLRSDQNNWLVKNMNFALGQDLDFSRITHIMNSFMTESTTQMYNFGKNNPNNALIRPGGIRLHSLDGVSLTEKESVLEQLFIWSVIRNDAETDNKQKHNKENHWFVIMEMAKGYYPNYKIDNKSLL